MKLLSQHRCLQCSPRIPFADHLLDTSNVRLGRKEHNDPVLLVTSLKSSPPPQTRPSQQPPSELQPGLSCAPITKPLSGHNPRFPRTSSIPSGSPTGPRLRHGIDCACLLPCLKRPPVTRFVCRQDGGSYSQPEVHQPCKRNGSPSLVTSLFDCLRLLCRDIMRRLV